MKRFDPFMRACIEEGMICEGAPAPECARDGTLTCSGGGRGEPRYTFDEASHQEFLLRGELLMLALGGKVRAELVELLGSRELVGEDAEYLLRHLDEGSLANMRKSVIARRDHYCGLPVKRTTKRSGVSRHG